MTITTTTTNLTIDETAGLQNATATPSPAGDANDNDIADSLPTAFATRLTALGVATSLPGMNSGAIDGAEAEPRPRIMTGTSSATRLRKRRATRRPGHRNLHL